MSHNREVVAAALRSIGPPSGKPDPDYPSTEVVDSIAGTCVNLLAPNGSEFGNTEVVYLQVQAKTQDRANMFCSAMYDSLTSQLRLVRQVRADSMIDELTQTREIARQNLDEASNRLRDIEIKFGTDLGELRNLNDAISGDGANRRALESITDELNAVFADNGNRDADIPPVKHRRFIPCFVNFNYRCHPTERYASVNTSPVHRSSSPTLETFLANCRQESIGNSGPTGDNRRDIGPLDRHPGIGEGLAGEMREGSAIPVDDVGNELTHHHPGVGAEEVEGRAQGVAHAESTDENRTVLPRRDRRTREMSEILFRAEHPTGHELESPDFDQKLVVTLNEGHLAAAGSFGPAELDPWFHEAIIARPRDQNGSGSTNSRPNPCQGTGSARTASSTP